MTSWKVAWTSARKAAGVQCRFHDLRHTCVTRLLERGVPLSVVASLMGLESCHNDAEGKALRALRGFRPAASDGDARPTDCTRERGV